MIFNLVFFLSIPNNSGGYESTIGRFDPIENSWTKLGYLNSAGEGHGVIQVDNEFIVVGGYDDRASSEPTESCKLNLSQLMICTTTELHLQSFVYYPELIMYS